MFELQVKPQQHIIDQGDDGDNFYIIEKSVSQLPPSARLFQLDVVHSRCFVCACPRGVYDIFVQKDGASVCVGKYDNRGSFGELALMYNTSRAATIVATEEGALWALVSVHNGASPCVCVWKSVVDTSASFLSLSLSPPPIRIEPRSTD